MKTALITFHAAHNNGSYLQAYALQKKVDSMQGTGCDIIDYISPQQEALYAVWRKNTSIREVLKNLLIALRYKQIKQRHEQFEKMQHKMQKTKQRYTSIEQLKCLESDYDVFISGSDQIWNMDAWDYSDAYFLSFIEHKIKVSYASSFGGSINSANHNDKDSIAGFLSTYSKIGVRENVGKKFVEQITQKRAQVVLDPTLLLESKDYESICAERIIKEDYIFFYAIFAIEFNQSMVEIVKQFSEIYNLPVYVMYTGNKVYKTTKYGFNLLKEAAPNHFLSMIKYAKYVLTGSFHGTAFSIIYKKQFYVVRGSKNGIVSNDDRMTTLLKSVGLEDRQLTEQSGIDKYKEKDIDYDIVDIKLSDERTKSEKYLEEALK